MNLADYPPGTAAERRRRSIRLPGHDYRQPGGYFVTICAYERARLFGEVAGDSVVLNRLGEVALACWEELPAHFPYLEPGPVVVMPNHVHGIIMIGDAFVGARHASPLQEPRPAPPPLSAAAVSARPRAAPPASLGAIVAAYKSAVARRIRENALLRDAPVWQRGYYEHVIRDEDAGARICAYIETNPLRWDQDRDNPDFAAAWEPRP
jgi:putative transposase